MIVPKYRNNVPYDSPSTRGKGLVRTYLPRPIAPNIIVGQMNSIQPAIAMYSQRQPLQNPARGGVYTGEYNQQGLNFMDINDGKGNYLG